MLNLASVLKRGISKDITFVLLFLVFFSIDKQLPQSLKALAER
jgi:hypothetical protein